MPIQKLGISNQNQSSMQSQLYLYNTPLNQQSCSVPSTPHQHPRKFSFGSRDPSPNATSEHSPRSAYSESNITLPSSRSIPQSGRCCYETALANIKRRMPYSLGGERLEKLEPSSIKGQLSPDEEKRLSADMRDLYQKLIPSPESESRRAKLVHKLEKLFNDNWPGHNTLVHVFGSSGNYLCTDQSDVDICITTEKKEMEGVCLLADLLAKNGMQKVICVSTAKVPIVKIWDPELRLACDMNVNNTLALENTRMIKTYVQIDERVRPLAMIIKHWTKRRIVNDAAFGGTLSSYTWICMIINFLQSRSPPILPALQQQPHVKSAAETGKENSFADDIENLRNFGRQNKESLGELLFYFFRFYAHEFDYDTMVVSVRHGKQISKIEKGWHITNNNRLCVEEPFNVGRNLGNTADDTSFRGLHMEIRRAFDLISQAKLEECCKEWNFPKERERKIWEPVSKAKVVLRIASTNRGGRGATQRANRYNGQQHRHGNSNRRASSGAFDGNPFIHGIPLSNVSPQDAWFQRQSQAQAQVQFHNDLYSTYSALQAHENSLRFQLYAQGLQAHAYAQSQTAQPPANTGISSQQTVEGTRTYDQPSLTPPVRQDAYYYPLHYYGTPIYKYQNPSPNPSSPSLGATIPELSRGPHRPAVLSGPLQAGSPTTSTLRSHSQPATRPDLQEANSQAAIISAPEVGIYPGLPQRVNTVSMPNFIADENIDSVGFVPTHPEESKPMEYVGYYVQDNVLSPIAKQTSTPLTIPAFGDIGQPKRRLSTDQLPQSIFHRLRRTSRSPSPLGHDRTFRSPCSTTSTQALPNQSTVSANIRAPSFQRSNSMSIATATANVQRNFDAGSSDESHSELKNKFVESTSPALRTGSKSVGNYDASEHTVPGRSHSKEVNEDYSIVNSVIAPKFDPAMRTDGLPACKKSSSLTNNKSESLTELPNGYRNLPSGNRNRFTGSNQNSLGISPLDTGVNLLKGDFPPISPVNSTWKSSSVVNYNFDLQSESRFNSYSPKSGERETMPPNLRNTLIASNSGSNTQKNISPTCKRHIKGTRSEGNDIGSWQQVPKGKKKFTPNTTKSLAFAQGQSEKLPSNVSDRKGG
ncbi:hypothetical protein K3495_g4299 [Podosphaera aphanis]|nr:hypothetical protein K3495_g4299 [Podosphaera aphanis]